LPLEYLIDHEKRFVTVTGRGVVALSDILDYMDAVVVQDAMGYPKLIDAREAVADLNDDDVMVLGARTCVYEVHDPRGPVAAVAIDYKTIGFLRRFMNLGGAGRPMRLFASLEEARAWLERGY
jgi:hypothetical protein